MPGPTPTFNWPHDLATAIGGLVVMLVAVPIAIAVSWLVERWGRRR